MVLLGLAIFLVVVMIAWVFFSDSLASVWNDFGASNEERKNKVSVKTGETVCTLKATVYGTYGFPITAIINGQPQIQDVKVNRVWQDCTVKGKTVLKLGSLYPEKLTDPISDLNTFAVYGRLFGEDFKWWVELHDPSAGTITKYSYHETTEKVPAGFDGWKFDKTFVFEKVPKKNLELWIYADKPNFDGHTVGEPYKQHISP